MKNTPKYLRTVREIERREVHRERDVPGKRHAPIKRRVGA